MASSAPTRQRRARPSRRKAKSLPTHWQSLQALQQWLLPNDRIFSKIVFHGNSKWTPVELVWLAFCWSCSEARCVTDAFTEAARTCKHLFGVVPISTYQGFMGALVTWTSTFIPLLRPLVWQRMEQIGGKFWRIRGWVPIAFDGSRSTAPRSKSNEAALCAANYGKGKTAKYRKKKSQGMRRRKNQKNQAQPPEPQAWITMMWHMGLRLPWCWRLGPSNASERQHVMDMVESETFPKDTLFCGDAGFVGYPLWSSLIANGHDFLVRVGANVSLLTTQAECVFEKAGQDSLVYCWPQAVMRTGQPPLKLRLAQVVLGGKTKVWMLTSVLKERRLPTKKMQRFYEMRWGIEIEFRGLKQTLNRAKLRCRNDQRLLAELDWSIMAMTMAELFTLKEQLGNRALKSGPAAPPADPSKRSLAGTMRALRECLRSPNESPELGKDLASRLRAAVTDSYRRQKPKRSRYRRLNPDKKPLGDPKLRGLTEKEKQILERAGARKTE
jgi:Transposase DDE domain